MKVLSRTTGLYAHSGNLSGARRAASRSTSLRPLSLQQDLEFGNRMRMQFADRAEVAKMRRTFQGLPKALTKDEYLALVSPWYARLAEKGSEFEGLGPSEFLDPLFRVNTTHDIDDFQTDIIEFNQDCPDFKANSLFKFEDAQRAGLYLPLSRIEELKFRIKLARSLGKKVRLFVGCGLDYRGTDLDVASRVYPNDFSIGVEPEFRMPLFPLHSTWGRGRICYLKSKVESILSELDPDSIDEIVIVSPRPSPTRSWTNVRFNGYLGRAGRIDLNAEYLRVLIKGGSLILTTEAEYKNWSGEVGKLKEVGFKTEVESRFACEHLGDPRMSFALNSLYTRIRPLTLLVARKPKD